MSGHVAITPNVATAYAVLLDLGDGKREDALSPKQQLNSLLAQAFLSRDGAQLPDWVLAGFGVLESDVDLKSAYMQRLSRQAAGTLSTVTRPETLFTSGTFPPNEIDGVGVLLTRYLITRGGLPKFRQLVDGLRNNNNTRPGHSDRLWPHGPGTGSRVPVKRRQVKRVCYP